eukprot:m51a1_g9443 putative pci domain-containing protein 2-like (430) ;mRNA; r:455549-457040
MSQLKEFAQDFLTQAGFAISRHRGDGSNIADLLRLRLDAHGVLDRSAHERALRALGSGPSAAAALVSVFRGRIDPPLDMLFAQNFVCLAALARGDISAAWSAYKEVSTAWAAAYDQDFKMATAALAVVVRTLRVIAVRAQREIGSSEMASQHRRTPLDDAVEHLRKFQNLVLTDRSAVSVEVSRKTGALVVVNEALRLFAQLRNTELANSLIGQIEKLFVVPNGLPPFETYPVSQRVVYRFYEGRLALLDGKYADADDALSWALGRCCAQAARARRVLLMHLVPVALVTRGKTPTDRLLRKYGLHERYGALIGAVRLGDVRAFDKALEVQMQWLVRRGVYLAFEAARAEVYKNFVRRVWKLRPVPDEKQRAKIPLELVRGCLEASGVQTDLPELECILARLVGEKRIKGYIAHSLSYLVVSNSDPFPHT